MCLVVKLSICSSCRTVEDRETGECLFAGSGGFFVGARFIFWISGCKFKCTEEYISRADDGGSDSSAIRVKREVFEHGTVGF